MTISAVSTSSPFLQKLETKGLSADEAKLVESDLQAAQQDAASTSTGAKSDPATVRAALDTRIAADVASGKLSDSDAAAVKDTLDHMAGQSGTSAGSEITATTAPASSATNDSGSSGSAPAGGGGGGTGGGGTIKTELSETVTITGRLKTTVVTYTDGTSSTTTTTATDADKQKYDKHAAAAADDANNPAAGYQPTIPPGSLVDLTA